MKRSLILLAAAACAPGSSRCSCARTVGISLVQYRVRRMKNHKSADCAYSGLELLPDGNFVTTTNGHWTPGEPPSIASVRLRLDEGARLDRADLNWSLARHFAYTKRMTCPGAHRSPALKRRAELRSAWERFPNTLANF